MANQGNSKRPANEKRKQAMARSFNRAVTRHVDNRIAQEKRENENRHFVAEWTGQLPAKRPSKQARFIRRALARKGGAA